MSPDVLLVPILSALASFIGAWLAAHFALTRFYKERIWERKAAAYSAIFAALHDIENWYSKHLDAYMKDRDLPKTDQLKLQKAARAAEDDLERRLASEIWLIPDQCRERITKLTTEISKPGDDWFIFLNTSIGNITNATNDLRELVRADLDIKYKGRLPC